MLRRALVALSVLAVGAVALAVWSRNDSDRHTRDALRRARCPEGLSGRLPARGAGRTDEAPAVQLTELGTFEQPVALVSRPGEELLYVAERTGRVVRLDDEAPRVVVDLSAEVSTGREQGLLGMAFSPDGGYLYTNHTDRAGDTRVTEWAFTGPGGPRRRTVLRVDQPHEWHNGGHLAFGPDGLLYIGLGDGGTLPDAWGNGQDLGTLLGKLLRIDPRPAAGRPYRVPADNPFVGVEGARPEIWAYGLRNPWRFSFDAETGDLWIADVGDRCFEELDLQAGGAGAGVNYGWRRAEGPWVVDGPMPDGYVAPVYSYRRDGEVACAVVGGHVYRGSALPSLRGWYVFGDLCHGDLLAWRGPGEGEPVPLGVTVEQLSSLGVDGRGELYALSLLGKAYRVTAPAR